MNQFSIYLAPYQAVYIDIAKVASSSIKATLATVLELDCASGNPHDIRFDHAPEPCSTQGSLYTDYYTFAFVRNPWDRLVSCYRDKIAGEADDFTVFADSGVAHCLDRFEVFQANMPFDTFVDAVASISDEEADEHFLSQSSYLTNASGLVAIDFVGQYERLAEDFSTVVRHIGLPEDTVLPHLQSTPRKDYMAYYTPHTRAVVEQRYARDIELFGYQFQG